jgi:hypothetical protein
MSDQPHLIMVKLNALGISKVGTSHVPLKLHLQFHNRISRVRAVRATAGVRKLNSKCLTGTWSAGVETEEQNSWR